MEIRVLRYFLTVAREKSINRAAEVLHITQPTLSRQISQLEDEVGVKLFQRGARKITLTNEGILLRRRAEEILSLVDKTEQELSEQEEVIEGCITIGSGELAAVQVLADCIADFRRQYPRVSYDILTANADFVKEQMEKGLLDIGVLLEPIDMDKFDFVRLKEKERWVVVMRSDDPLAQQKSVSAKDLAGKTLILPRRLNVRNELLNWFGRAVDDKQILFIANLSTNSAVMVERELGYAPVIEGSLPYLDHSKLTYRPLEPNLTAGCVVAWRRGQPFSPAVTKFIMHLQCFLSIGKQ